MRFGVLGIVTVLLFSSIGQADEKAVALVKKAIEAHGGAENLNKYKAGRTNLVGEMSILGMTIKFDGKLSYVTPDRYKLEMNAKIAGMKMVMNQVVNGKNVKNSVSIDGMKQPAGGATEEDELRFTSAIQEIGQLTPLLDEKKYEIKLLDDAEYDGKKYTAMNVKILALKKECKLYFDPKTNIQVMVAHPAKGPGANGETEDVLEESWSSDFKKINGVLVPMKLLVNHDGKKFMTLDCKDFELLENIDAKEFAVDD